MQLPDGWEFHEVVNLFPEMTADEFADLKADIAANGLKTEIPVRNGKILDGRHRIKACLELGSNEWLNFLAEYDTDPRDEVQIALTFNLHRRHLSTSQKAMIGEDVRGIYDKQAKERQKQSGGDKKSAAARVEKSVVANVPQPITREPAARDKAAKTVGVGAKSIDAATAVKTKGAPELVQAVRSGKVTVTAAAAVAKAVPKEKQVELVRDNKVKEEASRIRKEKKQPVAAKEPRHAGEHTQSETFAMGKADVAITQLKGIPTSNKHREAGLKRVADWMSSQRDHGNGVSSSQASRMAAQRIAAAVNAFVACDPTPEDLEPVLEALNKAQAIVEAQAVEDQLEQKRSMPVDLEFLDQLFT